MKEPISAPFCAKSPDGKILFSASSVPVSRHPAFSAESIAFCEENGFSVAALETGAAFFYDSDGMNYVSLDELRANYAADADYIEAEFDVKSFDEFIDMQTDMGGPLCTVSGFYAFSADGTVIYSQGDGNIDFAIDAACDYRAFEEEEGRRPDMSIVYVSCLKYEF